MMDSPQICLGRHMDQTSNQQVWNSTLFINFNSIKLFSLQVLSGTFNGLIFRMR